MKKVLQLKIQITGIVKPPVWRRIVISDDLSFLQLHEVIQAAFGWESYHLFQFSEKAFGRGVTIKLPDEYDVEFDDEIMDAEITPLSFVLNKKGRVYTYVYDFGDSWEHKITVEEIISDSVDLFKCIAGKGKCPPEDCGGIYGYENMKAILADKADPEHKEMLEWLGLDEGSDWDPKEFSLHEANEDLEGVK